MNATFTKARRICLSCSAKTIDSLSPQLRASFCIWVAFLKIKSLSFGLYEEKTFLELTFRTLLETFTWLEKKVNDAEDCA